MKTCERCEGRVYYRGLCQFHYRKLLRCGVLARLPVYRTGVPCRFPGCSKPARQRGFCWGCYTRQRRGKALPMDEARAIQQAGQALRESVQC